MFDFGFSELLVVCVVALLVLGPTRLPGLVRKVGRWVGKARSMARDFRDQLESEVNVEELNRAVKRHIEDPPAPPAEAGGITPENPVDTMASSGYPYGMPTDTSATAADPAVTAQEPQPGDDAFSHAHAPGAAPQPWSAEADAEPEQAQAQATQPATPADDGGAAPDPDKARA